MALIKLGSITRQKWEDDADISLVCGVNFLNISSDLVQIKAGAHTHIDSTNHKQSDRSVYSRSKEMNTKVGTYSTTFLCNFRVAFTRTEEDNSAVYWNGISYLIGHNGTTIPLKAEIYSPPHQVLQPIKLTVTYFYRFLHNRKQWYQWLLTS